MNEPYSLSRYDQTAGLAALAFLERRDLRENPEWQVGKASMTYQSAARDIGENVYALYAQALARFKNEVLSSEEVQAVDALISDFETMHRTNAQIIQAREDWVQARWSDADNNMLDNPRNIPYVLKGKIQLPAGDRVSRVHTVNDDLAGFFQPVRENILKILEEKGRVAIPAGFRKTDAMSEGHNIIAEIAKTGENIYSVTEYNVGYGTVFSHREIDTDEDTTTRKKAVYAQKRWNISNAENLAPIVDLYFQRTLHNKHSYEEITKELDALRGKPELLGETHVQDAYNCNTRTCRELARGHLTPETYKKFIAFIQSPELHEALKEDFLSAERVRTAERNKGSVSRT